MEIKKREKEKKESERDIENIRQRERRFNYIGIQLFRIFFNHIFIQVGKICIFISDQVLCTRRSVFRG